MAIPPLPALNSEDWYAHYSALDAAARSIELTVRRIVYSGTAYPARPSSATVPAGYAEYVGPTEPTDGLNGDTWVQATV